MAPLIYVYDFCRPNRKVISSKMTWFEAFGAFLRRRRKVTWLTRKSTHCQPWLWDVNTMKVKYQNWSTKKSWRFNQECKKSIWEPKKSTGSTRGQVWRKYQNSRCDSSLKLSKTAMERTCVLMTSFPIYSFYTFGRKWQLSSLNLSLVSIFHVSLLFPHFLIFILCTLYLFLYPSPNFP